MSPQSVPPTPILTPLLTIFSVDPRDSEVAVRLFFLQQHAYTVEAEQIGYADFPPLRETVEELQHSPDHFIVIGTGEVFLGALSFCESESDVTITRLVVSPPHHRRGIGTRLLLELDRQFPDRNIFVTTAQKNLPAVKLYERNAFSVSTVSLSREGILLIHFHKAAGRQCDLPQ